MILREDLGYETCMLFWYPPIQPVLKSLAISHSNGYGSAGFGPTKTPLTRERTNSDTPTLFVTNLCRHLSENCRVVGSEIYLLNKPMAMSR